MTISAKRGRNIVRGNDAKEFAWAGKTNWRNLTSRRGNARPAKSIRHGRAAESKVIGIGRRDQCGVTSLAVIVVAASQVAEICVSGLQG